MSPILSGILDFVLALVRPLPAREPIPVRVDTRFPRQR